MLTQVTLERDGSRQVTWIEARGAKVGNSVQLKETKDFWKVIEVYGTRPEREIREMERNYRGHRKATDI